MGYEAICGPEWFYGVRRCYNVDVLELYPILVTVHEWGSVSANQSICFFTDNEALVPIINMQTLREPHIMALLRPLVLACLRFNINFTASLIPGQCNILVDKLSHLQVDEFRVGALGDGQSEGSAIPCLPSRLRDSLERLLTASLAPSSRAHYERTWKKLVAFYGSIGVPLCLPVSVHTILLFIVHLFALGLAPSSIVSTVSAVAYFHKVNGFIDPSSAFIVNKLLVGACNVGAVPDVRLPVTLPILSRLVVAMTTIFFLTLLASDA